MKIVLLIISYTICLQPMAFSQEKEKSTRVKLLEETAEQACKCIDSINVYDKSKQDITKEVNKCIDSQTGVYQVGSKLMNIDDLTKSAEEKDGKKQVDITINMNKTSTEYRGYYYEMERYIMSNCKYLKGKMSTSDKQNEKSVSENPKSLAAYTKGIDELKNENYEKAIGHFRKALNIDGEFAFAWDNIGLCYRKLNNYDKSLEAYKRSLEIDPMGVMPLQNIAVVYQYKKEYQNAIASYEKLIEIDKDNPEIYYGLGQVYTTHLQDYEKGLTNMCKAYNLYIEQKSPYRTDAEKIIQTIYSEMKKLGQENTFNEILKANRISAF